MATVQPLNIITAALQNIGAVAPGEPVPAELAQQAFFMLNNLLDVTSNESFMVVSVQEITAPNLTGATSWTIGPGGDVNTTRPLGINSAFTRINTYNGSNGSPIDYPIAIINVEQYELIGLKNLPGPWVRAIYYNSGSPLGTLNLWPNPSQGELHLFVDQIFTQFTTINDTIQFPPGYNMWMIWALAELMMPAYGRSSSIAIEVVSKMAKKYAAAIKGTNMQPLQTVQFDPALGMIGRNTNPAWIYSGGFLNY